MISRRALMAGGFAAASFAEELKGRMKLTMPAGQAAAEQLRFIVYLGVDWVTMGGPSAPTYSPDGSVIKGSNNSSTEPPWKEADLVRTKQHVESFGLKIGNMMLHDFRDAILGGAGADAAIEKVQESIRVAGKVGIPVVEYNWYALRAMGGYYQEPGRGGSLLQAHDYYRSRNLPVVPEVGEHNAADLWKRYERFLKAVVPVAEKAGVRLAVHPNDPPPPRYRGVDQILGSVDGLRRVCEIVKSPANGITFDTGVTREMGFNVIENIQWFGKRDQINHVHFRNVIMKTPREKYTETFIDAGDNDMLACLKALHAVGYPRLIHPDHVPAHPDDANSRGGWGYAVGQIKAMMRQL